MVDPFIHIYLYVYNGGGSVIKFVATLCNSGRSLLAPLHILFTYSWRYSSKFLWRREKYWWGWWRAAYDVCSVDCTRGFVFLELCIVKLPILTDARATTSLANKQHRILSFISQNISKQPQMRSIHTSVMEDECQNVLFHATLSPYDMHWNVRFPVYLCFSETLMRYVERDGKKGERTRSWTQTNAK